MPRAGHQTQGGCTRAGQHCGERPTGLGVCPLLGSRPTRCLGTLVSTKGNSEAILTNLAVGLVSGVPGKSLAGVTGDEGPGPGTSQALSGGAGEGSVPAGAPATAVPAASLRTVLRETNKGRSWLTMGPGQLPPGLRCPPESSAPPRGQRSARAEAGASGSLGTSVWRLRLPCLPAPPLTKKARGPSAPAPSLWLPSLRETPRASGARWPPWVVFLQWGGSSRNLASVWGVSQGILGQQRWPPSKRPQGSPDPGLREVLVACSISTEDPPQRPPSCDQRRFRGRTL